ncbi:twin-arginine translocase TatA/TatE family subunit [Atopobiaceae bacterium SGI.236]|nr:twin-arginine translocase TatA/TatE family subunit [Atopobiaceae bacterium]
MSATLASVGLLGGIGAPELVVILVIVLVLFGPKRLPQLGSSLGKTVKNIREGMESEDDDAEDVEYEDDEDEDDEDEGPEEEPKPRKKKPAKKSHAE